MNKFWKLNMTIAFLLVIMYSALIYLAISEKSFQSFVLIKYVIFLSALQCICCNIYIFITYLFTNRKQSSWVFLYLVFMFFAVVVEVIVFFGFLSGHLGDSGPIGS